MNKALWVALLIALVSLAGCGRPYDSPEDTVETFLDACSEGDTDGILGCLESEDRVLLQELMMEGRSSAFTPPKGFEYSIDEVEKNGLKATATVTVRSGGQRSTDTMKLVKERGQWKIDLIPAEMVPIIKQMGGAMNSMQTELQESVQATMREMEEAMRRQADRNR